MPSDSLGAGESGVLGLCLSLGSAWCLLVGFVCQDSWVSLKPVGEPVAFIYQAQQTKELDLPPYFPTLSPPQTPSVDPPPQSLGNRFCIRGQFSRTT